MRITQEKIMTIQHTPGPWWVRTRKDASGEIVDCFVAAHDINGFAYDACILEDDEYREHTRGIERKLADATLVAAAPDLLAALEGALPFMHTRITKASCPQNGWERQRYDAALAAIQKAGGKI
jgi:hypothetical protein